MDTNKTNDPYSTRDYVCIALIFALLGAFFWAIRGTGGYGGAMGGALAGLGWGVLWVGFSRWRGDAAARPMGSEHVLGAIALGIMFGGFTGYGVYTAWVQGDFYYNFEDRARVRDMPAWIGFAYLFFCGVHWGGVPGAFMAWCSPGKPASATVWMGRIAAGIAGGFIASMLVGTFPSAFLPFYDEGIYQIAENKTAIRAQNSLGNIAPHIGLALGFLAFEVGRRDWRAVGIILVILLGFALPFGIGGGWHRMNGSGIAMPWWKFWEMTIGFGGGLSFGLAFYLFNRPAADTPPRATRVWFPGLIILFGCMLVFSNAWDGVAKTHEIEGTGDWRVRCSWLFLIVTTFVYGWLHLRAKEPVPRWVPLAVLLLIIVCGYAVSVHPSFSWNHQVLLTIYTGCMVVSAGLLALLRSGGGEG